jgi:sugar phosphate isomerase/epimerase
MNPYSRMRGEDWESYVEDIAGLGRRWGVRFTQSHLPYYDIFASPDREKGELMEELIRRSIIASGMLGIKWAVTHPGTVYEAGPGTEASLNRNLEYFSKHLETARKAGVGLALENDFAALGRPCFGADIRALCELADAFQDPLVGICYDFGHANLTGGSHRENLGLIGGRLRATHVQDNHLVRDDHLMPFFGETDWAGAMSALADIPYEGDLTYEIQEFARFMPNELKHLAVELSVEIGKYLIGLYERAKESSARRTAPGV